MTTGITTGTTTGITTGTTPGITSGITTGITSGITTRIPTGTTTGTTPGITTGITTGTTSINPNNVEANNYDVIDDIIDTNKAQTNNLCWHALNILKLIGAEEFIRPINRFAVQSTEHTIDHLNDYIRQNEKQLRDIIKVFDEKICDIKLGSKVTEKSFGIKFCITENGFIITNHWIKVDVGDEPYIIWPYNNTQRDELVPFRDAQQADVLQWVQIKCNELLANTRSGNVR